MEVGEFVKMLKNLALIMLIVIGGIIISCGLYYNYGLSPVSSDGTLKDIIIEEGTINDIANTLKENNLIRNVTVLKMYTRLTGKSNLKSGTYKLSEDMGTKEIVAVLEGGSTYNPDEISLTFPEGINIRKITAIITENTNNSSEDVYSLLDDETYLDELINEYWFLSNDIKNNNIYYSLEGYLFPSTYYYLNKDASVKDIFKKMLDEMDSQLASYKNDIELLDLSVHEFFTLASIVELEGANANDRKAVAGVFYNRLNDGWTLGSDVTTYYASKIDNYKYSLTFKELNDCSTGYNTRCKSYTGLPIGPIANPGIESLGATLYPEDHDYYYFVADCDGNVYLNYNSTGHNNTINRLINENNWCS